MIVLALLLVLLSGLAAASLLRTRAGTGAGLLGQSFFLGVIALALLTHMYLFIRIPVSVWTLLAGVIAVMAAAAWKGDRSFFRIESYRWSVWIVPVAASLLFLFAGAMSSDELGYDAKLFYLLKADSIVHYGTFWNPDFTDPARLHLATRRPLLLPSIYADFFLLARTRDLGLLRVWFTLIHAASLGVLYERARPHLVWLAVFAWIPALWHPAGGVFTGYADATLAVLLLLGFDSLRTREYPLAILALSAAVLLKQDAWPFLIAIAIATAFTHPRELPRVAASLIVPAGLAVTWFLIAQSFPWTPDFLPDQFEIPNFLSSYKHVSIVLGRVGAEMAKSAHWGAFWIVGVLGLLVASPRLHREDARWLLVLFMQLGAYIWVWGTYPADQINQAMRFQEMRILLHLVPLFWMWMWVKWTEQQATG